MGLVSKTWADYAGETTIHGIPDIQKANSWVRFVFWLLVFCGCFGLAIWEIMMVFEDYQASPIITTYELASEENMQIPPIQICPHNFVKKDRVSQIRLAPVVVNYALSNLFDFAASGMDFENRIFRRKEFKAPIIFSKAALQPTRVKAWEIAKEVGRSAHLSDDEILFAFARLEAEMAHTVIDKDYNFTAAYELVSAYYNDRLWELPAAMEKLIGPQPIDFFDLHYETARKYAIDLDTGNIDIEKIFDAVSFRPHEIFRQCVLAAKTVKDCKGLVTVVFDQRFGRCFLVNPDVKQSMGGVGIQIYIDARTFQAWTDIFVNQGGIKVRVEKPFNPTSVNVFAIPLGFLTFIRLQKTHYKLSQSEKYGKCHRDMQRTFTTYPYSDTSCRLECFLDLQYKKCGCLGTVSKQFRKPNARYPYCSESEKGNVLSNQKCLANSTAELDSCPSCKACVKACKPACEYSDYAPVVSSNNIGGGVMKVVDTQYLGEENATKWYWITKDNYVILDVAFASMEYMKVEQKDAISVHGLISQVGGQLGLFLGASAISFFQIAAIFLFCPFRSKETKPTSKVEDAEVQIYPIENKEDQLQAPQIHFYS